MRKIPNRHISKHREKLEEVNSRTISKLSWVFGDFEFDTGMKQVSKQVNQSM